MQPEEMVLEFRSQTRTLDSAQRSSLSLARTIFLLNQAQLMVMSRRYGPFNNYLTGFEGNQKRIQEFERIHRVHQPSAGITDTFEKRRLFQMPSDLMYLTRASFKGRKGSCTGNVKGFYQRSDTFNEGITSKMTAPSFEWRSTEYRLSEKNIVAYTDGTFELIDCDLDYLRYPTKIDLPGYITVKGLASKREECELPEFLHMDIVLEAAVLATAPNDQALAATISQVSQKTE